MDEPTASLDPERRRALWGLLEDLRARVNAVAALAFPTAGDEE